MNHSITYCPPPDNGLDILYIDSDLIIVNKPTGLLSVPGRGDDKQDCMITRIQQDYPEALTVHRLDMETSGILLTARSEQSQRAMSILFQNREVEKKYIAIVDGLLEKTNGEINLPLIADWPNRPKQKVDLDNGKPSKTAYKLLNDNKKKKTSRIELSPLTGRSHQLRVHMFAIGHAILGDKLYAPENIINKSNRLLLHASYISFTQPFTKKNITVECPVSF